MDRTDFLSVIIVIMLLCVSAGVGYILYLIVPTEDTNDDNLDMNITSDYTILLDSVDAEYVTVFLVKFNEPSELTSDAFTFYKNGNKLDVKILSWNGKQLLCSMVTDAEHCGKTAYEGLEIRY